MKGILSDQYFRLTILSIVFIVVNIIAIVYVIVPVLAGNNEEIPCMLDGMRRGTF